MKTTQYTNLNKDIKKSVWKEILKASKNAKEGKNISPEFNNVKDAMRWLNNNDKK